KKRRKNSCISSSISAEAPPRATRSVVRILTTVGPTWSTRSVKSGSTRAAAAGCCAWAAAGTSAAEPVTASAAASRQAWSPVLPSAWNIVISLLSGDGERKGEAQPSNCRGRIGSRPSAGAADRRGRSTRARQRLREGFERPGRHLADGGEPPAAVLGRQAPGQREGGAELHHGLGPGLLRVEGLDEQGHRRQAVREGP